MLGLFVIFSILVFKAADTGLLLYLLVLVLTPYVFKIFPEIIDRDIFFLFFWTFLQTAVIKLLAINWSTCVLIGLGISEG